MKKGSKVFVVLVVTGVIIFHFYCYMRAEYIKSNGVKYKTIMEFNFNTK